MTTTKFDLKNFYEYVHKQGMLRTVNHAKKWSDAVLRTLGEVLNLKTRRALRNALPQELGQVLSDFFWLLNFRDPELRSDQFCQTVARRSGNSNSEFAHYPIAAVFSGLMHFIDSELEEKVIRSLSPELKIMWQQAQSLKEST